MNLNRTGSVLSRDERNKLNENWETLENQIKNLEENSVLEYGDVLAENLGERSVEIRKTNFLKIISNNIYNQATDTPSKTINTSTGEPIDNQSNDLSDFISTIPGRTHTSILPMTRIAFYHIDKTFISTFSLVGASSGTFTSPDEAFYLRMVLPKTGTPYKQLNIGTVLLPFDTYRTEIDGMTVNAENVKNLEIEPNQFKQAKVSSNLFNHFGLKKNKSIDPTNGNELNIAGYFLTGFMYFAPATNYISESGTVQQRISFYTKEKVFISSFFIDIDGNTQFTTPANCYYVRVATNKPENFRINKGSVLLSYEPYYISIPSLKVRRQNIESIRTSSNNLINKFQLLTKKTISGTDGTVTDNEFNDVTNYYEPIKSNAKYTGIYLFALVYYDADMQFISRETASSVSNAYTYTTPKNAAFFRAIVSSSDRAQLNEGLVLLPFGFYKVNVNGVNIENKERFPLRTRYVVDGVLDKVYQSPTMLSYTGVRDTLTTDIYALYDALVTAFPDYITKSQVGSSVLGTPIYQYYFKLREIYKTTVDSAPIANTEKLAKMILVSGTHGDEKAGVFSLYYAMKAICENWRDDDSLETLRWNSDYLIVPVVSPDGYDAHTRLNANGVNIERNFPVGFKVNPAGDNYGGTVPLSEPETQVLAQLLQTNQDAILYLSYHNYGYTSTPTDEWLTWIISSTKLQQAIAQKYVMRMSRLWKKKYNWLPQGDHHLIGWIDDMSAAPASANAPSYAASLGIQGSIFEITQNIPSAPDTSHYSDYVLTNGTEAFLNYLLMNLKHTVDFYNQRV